MGGVGKGEGIGGRNWGAFGKGRLRDQESGWGDWGGQAGTGNWGGRVKDEQGMGRLGDNGIEGETMELEQENPRQEKTK